MNVHRTSSDTNDQIDAIKTEMISCSFANGDNDDMTIDIKGFLHNGRGFILTARNMEKTTRNLQKRREEEEEATAPGGGSRSQTEDLPSRHPAAEVPMPPQ